MKPVFRRVLGVVVLGWAVVAHAQSPTSVEVVLEPVRAMVVSAPVDGVLKRVAVEEGDAVRAGDLLVEFEHAEEALLVKRAEEVLRKREFDHHGAAQLFSDAMTSETEKLEKEIELRVAQLELAQAIERRDRRLLRAVQAGVVTRRHRVDGEYVERGTPLLEIVDQSRLDARFYVRPEDGLRLKVGDRAWVRVPLLGRTVACAIVFVDPQVDPSSGLMRARARIDNADGRLKAGLRGALVWGEKEPDPWP